MPLSGEAPLRLRFLIFFALFAATASAQTRVFVSAQKGDYPYDPGSHITSRSNNTLIDNGTDGPFTGFFGAQ